jgi:hypothetical protein
MSARSTECRIEVLAFAWDMTCVSRETSTTYSFEIWSRCAERHWSDTEIRDLRAIVRSGLIEAFRLRAYRATFRGCRVEIVRCHAEVSERMTFRVRISNVLDSCMEVLVAVCPELNIGMRGDGGCFWEPRWHRHDLSDETKSFDPTGVASPCDRIAGVTLAESARTVHVTHRPSLERAPKPATSPESRRPKAWRFECVAVPQPGSPIPGEGSVSPTTL